MLTFAIAKNSKLIESKNVTASQTFLVCPFLIFKDKLPETNCSDGISDHQTQNDASFFVYV